MQEHSKYKSNHTTSEKVLTKNLVETQKQIESFANPTNGEEEKNPINEIASSHFARRTFCGILYKEAKDPNAIDLMSGHAEGSKAFARYREIDEDMKKDLVNLLE